MPERTRTSDHRAPRTVLPYIVLGVALGLTAAGAAYVAMTVGARDRLRFEASVRRAEGRLNARIATYTAMLRATDGLFAARFPVKPDEFKMYSGRLDLRRNYPGVFGIGFAIRIASKDQYYFEQFMRKAMGVKDFAVSPPTSPEDDRSSIVYLEPLDERNGKAIGFDMYTEPVRQAAMRRARDEGVAAASGRVVLVQDKDDPQPTTGFLIYLPVYQGGAVPGTVEERQKNLRGWVYSPFRSKDLFGDVFAEEVGGGIEVRIYDGARRASEQLLYRTSDADANPESEGLESATVVTVAGEPWTVVMAAGPSFYKGPARYLPVAAGLGGAALSLGLFLIVRGQARARERAERVAADLRASRAALREAKESAEAANRLKDEFLATVSHELRTPLNAILGWAQLLSVEGVNAEDAPQGVETILRNARVQAQLVDDLLDISRIVSGKVRLEARPVDLAEVVRQAVASVALAAEAKGVVLESDGAGPVTIWGDPDRLQQVAWNLLSNAIKFTDQGGTIRASVTADGSHARLTVADSGVGMDPAFVPFAFERFRQADGSMTRKHGGLGLGLAIVKSLVEMHGGTVRAESKGAGRGATFTVTLPTRVAAGAPSRAPAGAPRGTAAGGDTRSVPTSLEGVRVLVVDDDPDCRDLVRRLLLGQRAEVATAATASRALEVMRSQPVDLLVSDLAMPDEDGYDLIRAVRQLPPQYGGRMPAIALSAMTRAGDRERALSAGYQLHLPKPVDPGVLTAAVGKLRAGAGSTHAGGL